MKPSPPVVSDPILSHITVDFGNLWPEMLVEGPFMSTAIAIRFTPEGFAIAADGLRQNQTMGGDTSESVQKIFDISYGENILAVAFAGAVHVTGPCDSTVFNFAETCRVCAVDLQTDIPTIAEHAGRLGKAINDCIRDAKETRKLEAYPSASAKDPTLMAKSVFIGYYAGYPSLVEIEFRQENQQIRPATIRRLLTHDRDLSKFEIFSGSTAVSNAMFLSSDYRFARYRTPSVKDKRLPTTLDEAVQLCEQYIQACKDDPLNDPECSQIGGWIHSAVITPTQFTWHTPPMSLAPS